MRDRTTFLLSTGACGYYSLKKLRVEKSGTGRLLVTSIPNDAGGVAVWGVLTKVKLLIKS